MTSITEAVSAFQTEWADTMDCLSGYHFAADKHRLIERVSLYTANGENHLNHRWVSLYLEQA